MLTILLQLLMLSRPSHHREVPVSGREPLGRRRAKSLDCERFSPGGTGKRKTEVFDSARRRAEQEMQTFAMNGKMEAGGIQPRSIIYHDRTLKRLEARYLIEMKVQGSQPDQQDRS